MGVLGLWQILESVGHPIKLEALEGKRLGVDASIWLYKFIRGYREKDASIDTHKLGLFNRISKLLFYKIKPVFVFDGPAPILKRRTLERRQNIRGQQLAKVQAAAMGLLVERLKEQYPDANIDEIKVKIPELRSNNLVAAEKLTDEDRRLFYLPPEVIEQDGIVDNSDSDHEDVKPSIKREHVVYHIDSDDEYASIEPKPPVDIHSEDFESLPPEVRYEILVDIRESRRKIRRANALPEDAQSFSNFQFDRLRAKRMIQEKIEKCERDICSMYTGELGGQSGRSYRVQSDANSTMLYLNNASQTPTSSQQSKILNQDVHQSMENRKLSDTQVEGSKVVERETKTKAFNDEGFGAAKKSNPVQHEKDKSLDVEKTILLEDDVEYFCEDSDQSEDCEVIYDDLGLDSISEKITPPKLVVENGATSTVSSFIPTTPTSTLATTLTTSTTPSTSAITSIPVQHEKDKSIDVERTILIEDDVEYFSEESDSSKDCEVIYDDLNLDRVVETISSSSVTVEDVVASTTSSIATTTTALTTNSVPSTSTITSIPVQQDTDESLGVEEIKIVEPTVTADTIPSTSTITSKPAAIATTITVSAAVSQPTKTAPTIEPSPVMANQITLTEAILTSTSDVTSSASQNKAQQQEQQHSQASQSSAYQSQASYQAIQSQASRNTNTVTTKIVEEAKELLRLFGIPYIDAAGEAEAQCALLERLNLTEGTITDDSDVWLFGSQNVYRYFFSDDKYVMQYKMTDIEFHVRLNRENLVCFAMLVGSDYTDGIRNIGPVTALEVLSEFPGEKMEPLIKFKSWRDKYDRSKERIPGSKKRETFLKFSIPEEFPSRAVFEGYMKPQADTSTEKFSWGIPDLDELREYARRNFGWDNKKIDDKLLPVMKKLSEQRTQTRIDSYFFKTAANQNPELFRSKRVNQALNKIASTTGSQELNLTEDEDGDDESEQPKAAKSKRKVSKKDKKQSVKRSDANKTAAKKRIKSKKST